MNSVAASASRCPTYRDGTSFVSASTADHSQTSPATRSSAISESRRRKFTFGTNPSKPAELDRSEYGIRMVQECKLVLQDFFVPGAWGPKAIKRKGSALKGQGVPRSPALTVCVGSHTSRNYHRNFIPHSIE
jgi:hypothetical protein